jgi:DNA-binding transcriptional MerR regulator
MSAASMSDYNNHGFTQRTVTPGEASTLTGIPGSTIRRYVKLFNKHMSASAQKIRGREFTKQDLGVLMRIRDLTSANVPLKDISKHLGEVIDEIPEEDVANMALSTVLRRFDDFGNLLEQQQAAQASQAARLDRLERLLEYNRLPWWRRLFTKPPE